MEPILEICCAEIESVVNARDGGADRIELCSALELDGLTPSAGLLKSALTVMEGKPVHVLIRPRGGDFVYNQEETEVIEEDIRHAVNAGAAGIVFGALKPDGSVDAELCRRLREQHPSVKFTFHRAFDYAADPLEALDTIIEMGFDYLLTSGQASDALRGSSLIRQLVERADGRIRIMAGGGVTPDNIGMIAERTGVRDLHGSAKSRLRDRSVTSRQTVSEMKRRLTAMK